MTDLRSTSDDRFEHELRATLLASTSPHAPRSLSVAARAIVARPPRRKATSWRLPAGLVAAALGVAILGLGLGPVMPLLRTAVAPAMSPLPMPSPELRSAVPSPPPSTAAASPEPSPSVPPAYTWQADDVRLTASDIEVVIGEERIRAKPDVPIHGSNFTNTPTRWMVPFILVHGERSWLLYLHLRSDGADWWLQKVLLHESNQRDRDVTFPGPFPRTPVGEAFHGDLSMEADLGGVPVGVELTDLTLEPEGLGTGPHHWEGCTLFTSLDPDAKRSLREPLSPRRFARLADTMDLCVVYLRVLNSTDGGHRNEVWCTPPASGAISRIIAGDSGEAVVTVLDRSTEAPREQPLEGWGCEPSPVPSPQGSASPSARP